MALVAALGGGLGRRVPPASAAWRGHAWRRMAWRRATHGGGFTITAAAGAARKVSGCRHRPLPLAPSLGSALAAPTTAAATATATATVAYDGGDYGNSYAAQRRNTAAAAPTMPTARSSYRSYDPASGTFLGYDGARHPCP